MLPLFMCKEKKHATVGHKVAGMNADLGHKPPLRAATGCGGSGDIGHSQTPSGSQL